MVKIEIVIKYQKQDFFAGYKVIFVKNFDHSPRVIYQALKIESQFRFLLPGTDSNYLIHDPHRKGLGIYIFLYSQLSLIFDIFL